MNQPEHIWPVKSIMTTSPPHQNSTTVELSPYLLHSQILQRSNRLSYEAPLRSFPPHIQHNSNEQRSTEKSRSNTVVILDSFSVTDSLTSIQVDTDGVEKREDGDNCESESGEKGSSCWFGAEVEDCCCDCTDVDRVFKLYLLVKISWKVGNAYP